MISENALEILKKRYFAKDKEGNIIEDWEGLCNRVSSSISQGTSENNRDEYKQKFYDMMHNLEFLPGSPTLFNAGLKLGQLSACFVLPIEDSMEGIFETLKKAALVFASGGGCGYNFSNLRKKGSPVTRTFGESSGPVSFIGAYDAATEVVKQGGRRKGANMGILNIDHPDIVEFIDSKQEEGKFSNFNLSVSVTDGFMEAVIDDKDFDLIDTRLKKVDQTVKARDLFNKIVERLHNNGEPGIIFIDTINNTNPLPELGRIDATNPCSEQPLLPYESCNLGSINLVKLVKEKQDTSNSYIKEFDWDGLANIVKWSVRFLDCVISVNKLPFKEIEDATLRTRKIGLGVMGFADTLLLLGIKYDSDDALVFADKLMEFITYYSRLESSELAKELGSFPAFEKLTPFKRLDSLWDVETLDWNMLDIQIRDCGLRNACITTIAPTGSISLIAGVSSAIEPNFQWKYTYNRVDQTFTEYHHLAKGYLDNNKELPDYFVTALEIKPEWHIKMQATFQKWIDSGISKTINLPNNATKEDVYNSIILAWKLGCKGTTLYRTGSREKEVLVIDKPKEEISTTKIHPRKRPEITIGKTIKVPVGNCGHLYVTVNSDEKGPCEVFVKLGKSGGCVSSHAESLGRIISAALRSGVDVTELIEQLKNIRCSKVTFHNGTTIKSCSDGIAYALRKILNIDDFQDDSVISIGDNPECPECGSDLKREGKCSTCTDPTCGYSKCA